MKKILCPHCHQELEPTFIAKVMGQNGGNATLDKLGKEHFKAMANKRWAKSPLDK